MAVSDRTARPLNGWGGVAPMSPLVSDLADATPHAALVYLA